MKTRFLPAVLLTAAVFLLPVGAAHAASTVAISGDTVTVTGGPGEELQLSHHDVAPNLQRLTVSNQAGSAISATGGSNCTHVRYDSSGTATNDPYSVSCDDAALNNLILNTDSGSNSPVIDVCFPTSKVNLGNGPSLFLVPACSDPTVTFDLTTGSGDDTITVAANNQASVTANLGAGKDDFTGQDSDSGPMTVNGGPGIDTIWGGAGNDTLSGGDDTDYLLGRGGNDHLDGGNGDDSFDVTSGLLNDPDAGADEYVGGPGTDTLNLKGHTLGVNLSLNDVADDGAPGEGDNVHSDIESIIGSTYDDAISGSDNADTIDGDTGNDTIHGLGGSDTIHGGGGNDFVYGDAGNDTVYGDDGDDTVDGGAGQDSLFGDLATCTYVGCPAGNDKIFARDGETDAVTCGPGADSAQVDASDVVATDALMGCEAIDRSAAVVPGPGKNVGDIGASKLGTFTFTASGKPSLAHGLAVAVTCTTGCKITLTFVVTKSFARSHGLGKKAVSIGSATASLTTPGTTPVTLKFTKNAKKKLAKLKKFNGTLTIAVSPTTGTATSSNTPFSIKGR